MARRATRRATRRASRRGGLRVVSRVYAPVGFVLNSTGKIVKGTAETAGKLVNTGFKGIRNIGKSVAKGANTMINTVVRGKRGTRRN